MGVIVEPGDPREAEARALLAQSHRLMQSLYPADQNHFLPVEALAAEGVQFYVAREYDTTLGCAALAVKDGYGEVKSLFTAPFARGKGVAKKLMARLELEARTLGLPVLRLETGPKQPEALALYEGLGFGRRGPFGDYTESPGSVFYEKSL
ncbi:GNAT family N-acetyltransferase [Aquicoccus sp. SCR17]|nr:GNAT family N-acetyltransferase [Carideicomes alvinocaridis]